MPNEICGRIGRPALAVSTDSAPDSAGDRKRQSEVPATNGHETSLMICEMMIRRAPRAQVDAGSPGLFAGR